MENNKIEIKYRVYDKFETGMNKPMWFFAIAVITPRDTQYVRHSPISPSRVVNSIVIKYDEYPFFAAETEQEAHDAANLYIRMLISNIEDDLKRWSEPFQRKVIKVDIHEVPVEFDRTMRPGEIKFEQPPRDDRDFFRYEFQAFMRMYYGDTRISGSGQVKFPPESLIPPEDKE